MWRLRYTYALGAVAALGLLLTTTSASLAGDCSGLASVTLPDVESLTSQLVPAGDFRAEGSEPLAGLPEFCRVTGQIKAHSTSRIAFEVWLPTGSANGRFLQVGNGGFAGVIRYDAMAKGLREGYAVANTDDGTSAAPGTAEEDRMRFLGDLERVYDFKGRAVTQTTAVAKELYRNFYAAEPAFSYFTGGSSGGLEALSVVQRIGEEFDGVVAGCPANNSAGLFTQALWTFKNYQILGDKVSIVHEAAIAACDKVGDDLEDGIIGNPMSCKFDPQVLQCGSGQSGQCLTVEQVEAARAIYAGPVNPSTGTKTGEQYAPGMPVGSEMGWPTSEMQATFASQPWFGMLLHDSVKLDMGTFDFEKDVARAKAISEPFGAQVTDPKISKFRDHGGKLILFAGWNDPLWSQGATVKYYEDVLAQSGDLEDTKQFARLFMVPGMEHCGGGEGITSMDATWPALVDWVEQGAAPETIMGSREIEGKVEFTRPVCAYPAVAKYSGSGSPDEPTNYSCVGPVVN